MDRHHIAAGGSRRYSNYLTPRTGLFSADRLTVVVIYLRNLLLNWLVILPAVIVAIVLVKLVAALAWLAPLDWRATVAITAVTFMGMSFVDSVGQRPGASGETTSSELPNFYWAEILPMLLGALCMTIAARGFAPFPSTRYVDLARRRVCRRHRRCHRFLRLPDRNLFFWIRACVCEGR